MGSNPATPTAETPGQARFPETETGPAAFSEAASGVSGEWIMEISIPGSGGEVWLRSARCAARTTAAPSHVRSAQNCSREQPGFAARAGQPHTGLDALHRPRLSGPVPPLVGTGTERRGGVDPRRIGVSARVVDRLVTPAETSREQCGVMSRLFPSTKLVACSNAARLVRYCVTILPASPFAEEGPASSGSLSRRSAI